ncbi:MAG: tetratricopeptide repeat protein [Candidatus Kapaibacterium sp.]
MRSRFSRMGLLALLLSAGCLHAPRPRLLESPVRDGSHGPVASASASRPIASSRPFTDTSVILVSGRAVPSVESLLASARKNMDEQSYAAAEDHIRMILETGAERDSVTDEARFLLGESYVMRNMLPDARSHFTTTLKIAGLTPAVRERCLLRLGHVLCAEGKEDEALKVFRQFLREFPGSSYASLADCSAVGR